MTPEEVAALEPGLYVLTWMDGGETPAAVGDALHGKRWYAPVSSLLLERPPEDWSHVAAAVPVEVWNRRAAAASPPKKPKAWPRRRLLALAVVECLRDMCGDGGATIPAVAVRRLRDDLVRVANLGYEKPHIEPTIVQAYGGPT